MVEDVDGDTALDKFARDVCLQVGKAQDQVWLKREDLVDPGARECRNPWFLLTRFGRPDRESRDPHNPILLSQQIKRLRRLLGEANDTPG